MMTQTRENYIKIMKSIHGYKYTDEEINKMYDRYLYNEIHRNEIYGARGCDYEKSQLSYTSKRENGKKIKLDSMYGKFGN